MNIIVKERFIYLGICLFMSIISICVVKSDEINIKKRLPVVTLEDVKVIGGRKYEFSTPITNLDKLVILEDTKVEKGASENIIKVIDTPIGQYIAEVKLRDDSNIQLITQKRSEAGTISGYNIKITIVMAIYATILILLAISIPVNVFGVGLKLNKHIALCLSLIASGCLSSFYAEYLLWEVLLK